VKFIGSITISEIFSLIFIGFFSIKNLLKKYPLLTNHVKYLLLYLVVQIFSDILNRTGLIELAKGWSVIVFSVVSTITLVQLFKFTNKNIIIYLFGLFLTNLIIRNTEGSFDSDSNYFKSNIIPFLNPLILVLSILVHKYTNRHLCAILLIVYAVFSIYFDGRSNGFIFIFSAFLLLFRVNNLSRSRILLMITLGVIVFSVFFQLYVKVIDLGLINSKSSGKITDLSGKVNIVDFVKSGRAEIFVMWDAALNKPLVGHGSWPKDVGGDFNALLEELHGVKSGVQNEYIPTHSILIGGFLYAGIFGLMFLSIMFYSLFKVYFTNGLTNFNSDHFSPLYSFLIVDMFWAVIFSPFGLLRATVPFFASVIIVCFQERIRKINKVFT